MYLFSIKHTLTKNRWINILLYDLTHFFQNCSENIGNLLLHESKKFLEFKIPSDIVRKKNYGCKKSSSFRFQYQRIRVIRFNSEIVELSRSEIKIPTIFTALRSNYSYKTRYYKKVLLVEIAKTITPALNILSSVTDIQWERWDAKFFDALTVCNVA